MSNLNKLLQMANNMVSGVENMMPELEKSLHEANLKTDNKHALRTKELLETVKKAIANQDINEINKANQQLKAFKDAIHNKQK